MKKMVLALFVGVICMSGALKAGAADVMSDLEAMMGRFETATDPAELDALKEQIKDKAVFKGVNFSDPDYKDSAVYKGLGFMNKGKVRGARLLWEQAGIEARIDEAMDKALARIQGAKEAGEARVGGAMEQAEGVAAGFGG